MDKLARAEELGVLNRGWTFTDYALTAIPNYEWIDSIISGEKGSGKSNYLLQSGYRIFHGYDRFEVLPNGLKKGIIEDYDDMEAWRATLDHTIFRPVEFAQLLSKVLKNKRRLSWVGADDFNLHFPRSLYSTNRRLWERFQKNWEAFRANLSIFQCTVPRKDTVISVILKDLNWDILVSNRHMVEVYRWFYDISFFEPDKVIKMRIDIETEPLKLDNVPKEIWSEYWNRKQSLVDEETEAFSKMLEDMDTKKMKEAASFICSKCGRDLANSYNLKVHFQACKGILVS